MSNKYKIIRVDRRSLYPMEDLEVAVNEFLDENAGYVPNTPPVVMDDDVAQMLVHISVVENV